MGVLSIFFSASGINIFVSKYVYMIASLYNFEHYSKKSVQNSFQLINVNLRKMSVTKKGAVSPPPPLSPLRASLHVCA